MERWLLEPPVAHRGGIGEPLVLLHGAGATWHQWRPVIPLLERHYQVLAVNLVGHWGGPPQPSETGVRTIAPGPVQAIVFTGASIDLFVDGVEHELDEAGWQTPHVAGISLGGLVALVLASRGRARSCSAIATLASWQHGRDARLRFVARSYGALPRLARLAARDPARCSRCARLRRLLYWHHFAHPERMDPAETAHMIVGLANAPILPALGDWILGHDGPTGLDQIRCPVQLLFPTEDLVVPRKRYEQRLVSAVTHAEVHEIPGAGHGATWDTPELVAESILRFTSASDALEWEQAPASRAVPAG